MNAPIAWLYHPPVASLRSIGGGRESSEGAEGSCRRLVTLAFKPLLARFRQWRSDVQNRPGCVSAPGRKLGVRFCGEGGGPSNRCRPYQRGLSAQLFAGTADCWRSWEETNVQRRPFYLYSLPTHTDPTVCIATASTAQARLAFQPTRSCRGVQVCGGGSGLILPTQIRGSHPPMLSRRPRAGQGLCQSEGGVRMGSLNWFRGVLWPFLPCTKFSDIGHACCVAGDI